MTTLGGKAMATSGTHGPIKSGAIGYPTHVRVMGTNRLIRDYWSGSS